MYPNVSECVKTGPNRAANVEKLRENIEKLRETVEYDAAAAARRWPGVDPNVSIPV